MGAAALPVVTAVAPSLIGGVFSLLTQPDEPDIPAPPPPPSPEPTVEPEGALDEEAARIRAIKRRKTQLTPSLGLELNQDVVTKQKTLLGE
jgi:hypothetical protein